MVRSWGQCAAAAPSACGRGGSVCSASPGKEDMTSRTGWSPPLPVFGDRKTLQSPLFVLPPKSYLHNVDAAYSFHEYVLFMVFVFFCWNFFYCCTYWQNLWNWGCSVFNAVTPWHFLPLCLRTFSVVVCSHSCCRFYITEAQALDECGWIKINRHLPTKACFYFILNNKRG